MKRNVFKNVVAMMLVFGLVGCGGGGSGSSGSQLGDGGSQGDTTPPTVELDPADAGSLLPDAIVTLTFSEAMASDSVTLSGSLENESGEHSWSDDSTLVITPETVWTESAELSLIINGKDASGNAMEEVSVAYLVSDITAPSVTSISPDGIRLEKDAAIVVHFSESMDKDSLAISGELAEEGAAGEWSQTEVENDTLTIAPAARWTSAQDRVITISATDAAGNALGEITETYTVPLEFENFDPAEVVIGKSSFTSTEFGVDGGTASLPYGNVAVSDSGQLFIGDYGNNRVLGYSSLPEANGTWADFVLGQVDFTSSTYETSRSGMDGPQQVSIDGNTLAVAEYGNNRVLIYNSIPQDSSALPDVVVGQPDFDSSDYGCTESGLSNPETAVLAGGKLIVTDSGNNRVLVWNSVPTTNGAAPDIVLGQSTLESCEDNDDDQDGTSDNASSRTLSYPAGIWSNGERLAVVDNDNSRVMLWNSFPSDNFQPVDVVLGQENFTDVDPLETAAATLAYPYDGVWSNGIQLFVADTDNNRVLIWNSWPEDNFVAADVVLGQGDFSHSTGNDANQDDIADADPAQSTMHSPTGVFGYRDLLFVSDLGNDRVLMFRSR